MTIGILCAIPQEYQHLRVALEGPLVALDGSHDPDSRCGEPTAGSLRGSFVRGRLEGREVVLAAAGIGKVNTAIAATLLADRLSCRMIVFSGVAGGLDPALAVGDVVIASHTIQHDAGVLQDERIATYQAGHIPFFNPTETLGYAVDAALLGRVRGHLEGFELPPLSQRAGGGGRPPVIAYGTILSGDQFLNCETTRLRLHQALGGLAVEMEGAALGQAASVFGIPYLDIRALSDLAGRHSAFDFGSFVEEVAARSALILRHILPVL